MTCRVCGHDNRAQAKFCGHCGERLAFVCERCGEELDASARFCDACGAPTSVSVQKPQHDRRLKSPGIDGAIRPGQPVMEGERRVVTVLFADAVGHTSISERLDEEQVYGLMQGCFERMRQAVEQFDGTVNQFTGDGVLALFGAPIAHEDSARNAVSAALEMQRQLAAYAAEVNQKYSIQCSYRVGLNTGPVVVGKISDRLDLDFTAVGDTVNLASRMESMAESGTVYLTEHTYRAVQDYFDCERIGPLVVKGKSSPVVAYKALREKPVRMRLDAASARGLTAYVGRDEELNILHGYLDRTRRDQGHVVYISGEAGMGKSRLLLEFKNSLESGVRWLEGQCAAYGRMTPYLPFIDLVKNAFNIGESATEAEIVRAIDEATAGWNNEGRHAVPYLKYLLQVDPGDAAVAAMDPRERRPAILDALRALILELSAQQRLALAIEDLHWMDERSLEALQALVEAAASAPVLFILTSRPGYVHPLPERSYFSRLALGSLRAEESSAMVGNVLHASSLPTPLLDLIAKKAEGNPFYIEEVAKSLVESGVLVKRNGTFAVEGALDSIHIPDTIQEVILARMDRLDRDAKGAMQLASVIGREFTVRLLERIADVETKLQPLLGELKTLELIYESRYSPELSYMFKHALTHEVAYSTLLVERRRALHRILATAIEELYADRLAEHYEVLAYHYQEGQSWEKALDYLERAGTKAVDAYANEAAIDFFSRAIEVSGRIGQTAAIAMRILERRAWVYFSLSRYAASVADAGRIAAMARDLGDSALEGRALALQGLFLLYNHDFDQAEEVNNRAIAISEKVGAARAIAAAHAANFYLLKVTNRHEEAQRSLQHFEALPASEVDPYALGFLLMSSGMAFGWRGEYTRAIERLGRWRTLPAGTPFSAVIAVRWGEAVNLASVGRFNQALPALEDILRLCCRMGDLAMQARTLNTLGWIYNNLQDHNRAIELNHEAIEVALQVSDEPEKISNARLNWADALIATGRFDEAKPLLAEVEKVVRHPSPKDRWMLWRFSQHFFATSGRWRLATDDAEGALGFADECLALAEHSQSAKFVVQARQLRAEALYRLGDPTAAIQEVRQATANADKLGSPMQLWNTYRALGDLLAQTGHRDEAAKTRAHAAGVMGAIAQTLRDESLRRTVAAACLR